MKKHTITEENVGRRLDHFIVEKEGDFTRGEIISSIKAGEITVNEKIVKQGYKLRLGDEVFIASITPAEAEQLVPHPNLAQKLIIVAENDHFIIVDKPRGIQTHPSTVERYETLANALVAKYPEIAEVGDDHLRPGIVHRLDKYTSGLMVVARNQEAFDALKVAFAERRINKSYEALVWGALKESEMTIDVAIARSVGYTKQKVIMGNTRKFKGEVKDAVTDVRVIADYEVMLPGVNGGTAVTHIEAKPQTGRMHQIRVHMAHVGHPILGDVKYEHKPHSKLNTAYFSVLSDDVLHTFYLHAKELSFELAGESYNYQSATPDYFTQAFTLLKKKV